ncbi:MAG: hypothetical protein COA45_06635 [Zetaproteobacteria bacterium]|nr:MAG: hypothetical protein COA45_06635 [Zetaproteobacteria bacterium]
MYCWNIEALKRDLHNDSLGEKAKFLYMFVYVILLEFILEVFTNMSFQEGMSSSVWDWGFSAAIVFMSAIGTIMAFKANGGSDGHDFLGKYFSIGFVVGIRVIPIIILLLLGSGGIGISLVLYAPDWINISLMTSAAFGVPIILVTVWMYWRICKHIKDIRVGKVIDVDTRKLSSSLPFYILATSFFAPFIAISVFAVIGLLNAPYSYVISGGDISAAQYKELQDNEIIATNEKILLFYSGEKDSILEGGNILTEERVIAYYEDTDDLEIYIDSVPYEKIQKIVLFQEGVNLLQKTMLNIHHAGKGVSLMLHISAEQAGDDRFIEMLENKTGLTVQNWDEQESESAPSEDVDASLVDDVNAVE